MNLTKCWSSIFYHIKPGTQSGINPETGVVAAQGDSPGAGNILNPGLQVQKTGFVTAAGGPSEEGNILNSKSQVPSKPETSGVVTATGDSSGAGNIQNSVLQSPSKL